jgi:type I restriction enzyme M protein
LIDASQLYRKLRKNLGNKNCEFAPEHITEIIDVYQNLKAVERAGDEGIASKIFDNQDFGYYKVSIERPKRLKAQFSQERINELRFVNNLREPMQWVYETYGEQVYTDISLFEKPILDWCEAQELNLSRKLQETLVNTTTWQKQLSLMKLADELMTEIGTEEFDDFNAFKKLVDNALKARKEKLSASEKNAILNAVSWYDANAEKVIKGTRKLDQEQLSQLLQYLGCNESQLPDFGYYPTDKKGEYLEYETESDLRDTENVPLKEQIYDYFIREVKPHVSEAWLNLDATKIGYEISFNKYFYRHKPLRELEDVTTDILNLENESDGLIREILGF